MENRHGLVVDFRVEVADGRAEWRNALAMLDASVPRHRRVTLGADEGNDTHGFVAACRERNVTPHVAQHLTRWGGSGIDARTSRTAGHAIGQRVRKRVEEIFGWTETVAGFRKTRFVGLALNRLAGLMVAAAYNLPRIANLLPLPEPA